MRGKRRAGIVAGALVLLAVVVVGIGANPRYIEELRIGGGYGEPVDGGVDFEKDGDIYTDGGVTAATYNGVDLSSFPQSNIDDSDEDQEFPGTDHTADQATNVEEELDAIRHMLSDMGGETHWYDEVPVSLKSAEDSLSNTSTGHNHDGVNSRAVSLIPGDLSVDGDTTVGDNYTVDVVKFDAQVDEVSGGEPSHLFRAANPKNYVVNSDCEVWLDGTSNIATGWTETNGGCTFAREASTVKYSKYSMKVTTAGQPVRLDATLSVTPTQARGRTFTLGLWVYTDTPASTKIVLRDDEGNAQVTASQTDSWELLTVTRTIDASTTTIRTYLYVPANGVVVYLDGAYLVEGPMEYAFVPGEEHLGYVNLSLGGWWDSVSSEAIDVADTDPAFGNRYVQWANADTDWIITTVVIPEDYDTDADDAWFVGYYSLSGGTNGNTTLDFMTRLQVLGSTPDSTDTNYDHTQQYHGAVDMNIDRAVYKIDETMKGGDVLLLLATREDDGTDDATLNMRGAQLVYVKR
jgi:hypothetical protein